jgi:hypothetical protein
MTAEIYRRFAERCRRLALLTRTEIVREKLLFWAEEFERQADEMEHQEEDA